MQIKIMEILNNLENNKSTIKSPVKDNILFKLPITYIDDKYPLQNCIKYDLELYNRENDIKMNNESSSLYSNLFNPVSEYANKIIPLWNEYYTTNINFLNDSKYLIKNFKYIESPTENEYCEKY